MLELKDEYHNRDPTQKQNHLHQEHLEEILKDRCLAVCSV